MAEKRDLYEVLGLSKSATDQDIKKAYRSLAKKFHPDVNKEKGSDLKFKEVQEAYDTLMDPQKRAAYDQYGHAGMEGTQGFGGQGFGQSADFGDLNDIFGSFFGGGSTQSRRTSTGPRQGDDRLMRSNIDFMDAVSGKEISFTIDVDELCSECLGTGAFSKADIKVCPTCQGKGQVTQQQRTPFGVFQSTVACPECHGTGKKITKKCTKCNGTGHEHKKVTVDLKIPAGIASGQRLRVPHRGERGVNGGPNGDLYIEIIVAKHKYFIREGSNIYIKVPLSALDATLGTKIDVPTIYGDVELTIPPATQNGTQFRLKGKGMKELNSSHMGDQYLEVKVEVDEKLSREEKELYEKLRLIKGRENIYERFKKSFK